MRFTKALPALVLLLVLVAGTASAYISENPRQGLTPISAEFHPKPTPREPGMILGFELRFLGFCVRSGLISTDPFGLKVQDLLDELYPIDKRLYCELQSLWDANDYEGVYQKSKQIGNGVNRELENLIYDDFDLIKGVAPSWAYPNFLLNPKFKDHGKDFGVPNTATYDPIVYARLAAAFLAASKTGIYEVAVNSKGEIRVYDRATRTLGSYRKDEKTVNFFKVDATDPGLWDRKKWDWGYEGFEPKTPGQP